MKRADIKNDIHNEVSAMFLPKPKAVK